MRPSNVKKVVMTEPSHIEDSSAPWDDLVEEDFHVAVYRDRYPVTEGHLLYVPKYNSVAILIEAMESAVLFGTTKFKKGYGMDLMLE
jgi:hypothetical protein